MQHTMTRRTMFESAALAGVATLAVIIPRTPARAAEPTPLDPNDPQARALGFVVDASTVSVVSNPTFKSGEACRTCVQYLGKPNDLAGVCNIYAGHMVPAGGWCRVWGPKPVA
jgi:hypothetical protein